MKGRMSAKNVKTLRAAHDSWNKRDFAGVVCKAVTDLAYNGSRPEYHAQHSGQV
jgi:hypothetical protein